MRCAIPSFLLLAAPACVSPKPAEGGDDTGGAAGTEVTIYDIQQGLVEPDTTVTLEGVLVSTPVNRAGRGFFLQEPEGGEWSGIYVYVSGSIDAPDVSVGDEVRITASVSEYQPDPDDPETITELVLSSPTGVEVTGSGTVEPAEVGEVDDWEPWEGVLVRVPDQEVLDCPDSYGEALLSGGLEMDDAFIDLPVGAGDRLDAVVGPIHYNWGAWSVLPRSEDDLEGLVPGEGCDATCAEVQQGLHEGGTQLRGVVATSPLAGDGAGFFVQDPGGGEWAGLYVYLKDVVIDDVQPGRVLDVYGSAEEYYDLTELVVTSVDDVVFSDTTEEPVVSDLDAPPADWESWEGVLVRLHGLVVTSDPDQYGEVETDWGIKVDDFIADHGLVAGTECATLTGLVSYTWGEWKLMPRSADDLADCTAPPGKGG